MDNTYLDGLVDFPVKALHRIGTDPMIVSLLTDNENIDMTSEEADEVFEKYLFDYGYVDNTTTEAAAYICVEAETTKSPTNTIQDMYLFVTVTCHKQFMKLDSSRFKGMTGNRRDNLVRCVDNVLNSSMNYGIGALSLQSVRTAAAPAGFSAREITYTVPGFSGKKES